jgi:hypothetical protein
MKTIVLPTARRRKRPPQPPDSAHCAAHAIQARRSVRLVSTASFINDASLGCQQRITSGSRD